MSYPEGIDFVWFAVDQQDQVAAFVTGGSGPMPRVLVDARPLSGLDMEALICELPPTSDAKQLSSYVRVNDWLRLAERGVFAYDWSDVHRAANEHRSAYELLVRPTHPRICKTLPGELKVAIEKVRITNVTFGISDVLDVRKLVDCVDAPTRS